MSWFVGLPWLSDLALLVLRLVIGVIFLLSGYFKLVDGERRDKMKQSVSRAGLPQALATPLSALELLGGLSVVLGLLTVAGAAALLAITVGALATTAWPKAEGEGIHKLENLLYSPEAILAAGLLCLMALGAGGWSLDAALLRR